tara:strand:- start:530 stop:877 length:348 start_codon:yes stop_codon:yes gene_type:complete
MTKCRECYDDGYIWTNPSGSDDDRPRFEKCDCCGILKTDIDAKVKASSRRYFVVWWHGYVTNEDGKPTSTEIMQDDMTIDNGWSEEDIEKINSLLVTGRYTTGGPIEEVTVYRWK